MYRLILLRVIVLLIFTVLVGRLYQLQLGTIETSEYTGENIAVTTTRYVLVPPRRGEILARDGQTLLAESVAIYSIAVLPGSLPPLDTPEREIVLGRAVQVAEITSTLTFSPTLTERPSAPTAVWRALRSVGYTSDASEPPISWDVPPDRISEALRLTQTYSDVLVLENPIETQLEQTNAWGYETVVVKENISRELALVIRENSAYLPGVVVVEDYQRRYPQSDSLLSLSHIIGYIGRIDSCELVANNPASSWLTGLADIVSNSVECGLVDKEVSNNLLGTLSYRHDDRLGKDGLEAGYEAHLRGQIGIDMLAVDALERPVSERRTVQPVVNGYNLVTTLDVGFQRQVETILQRWINEGERRRQAADDHRKEYKPITNGVAVVVDIQTGDVLAIVSLPAYSNNIWVDRNRSTELEALLAPSTLEAQEELQRLAPLTNRAIGGRYPPGSALKPFVGAVALQEDVIQADTELRDPGRIVIQQRNGAPFALPNSVVRDNGEITLSEALRVSSNVFFASIAGGNDQATNLGNREDDDYTVVTGLKIDRLASGLKWFGLGSPTGLRLPGEAIGRVPSPNWKAHELREPWTTGDTFNTSIGQGYLEVTPLQLAIATAALASDGVLMQPRLVQAVTDDEGNIIEQIVPQSVRQTPIDAGHYNVVRDGMRRSVTEGLNTAAHDVCSGLRIAGKTGTAEFGPIVAETDERQMRQSHAWFAAFAPYENPEIAVVVLLEGTGDLEDGSSTLAVPAVTQIMQAYFGVTPPLEPIEPAEQEPAASEQAVPPPLEECPELPT